MTKATHRTERRRPGYRGRSGRPSRPRVRTPPPARQGQARVQEEHHDQRRRYAAPPAHAGEGLRSSPQPQRETPTPDLKLLQDNPPPGVRESTGEDAPRERPRLREGSQRRPRRPSRNNRAGSSTPATTGHSGGKPQAGRTQGISEQSPDCGMLKGRAAHPHDNTHQPQPPSPSSPSSSSPPPSMYPTAST